MKKLIYFVAILAWGCGGPPKPQPLDGVKLGKELAAWKVAANPSLVRKVYTKTTSELLQSQRFGELNELLERLGKSDPIETLCTPTLLVNDLCLIQPDCIRGHAWLMYHALCWSQLRPGPWSQLANVIGYTDYGTKLMNVGGGSGYPTWDEVDWFYNKGLEMADKAKPTDAGWAYLELLQNSRQGTLKAILAGIKKHPQELALYDVLQQRFVFGDRAQKRKILQDLADQSLENYTLFFTWQLPNNGRKVLVDGWEWEKLRAGFQQLLEKHPNALGVRNAYALAAHAFEDEALMIEQLAKLGYQWDPEYWGSLTEYKKALGKSPDYHLSSSEFAAPALNEFLASWYIPGVPALESEVLAAKGLWEPLEVFQAGIDGPDRYEAEAVLEEPGQENEAGYRKQERLLREWEQARPESAQMRARLGGFYIHYAWLARGSGYADTVPQEDWNKFHQRLKRAQDLIYEASQEGEKSGLTMANLMVLYKAESANKQSAAQLALKAAKSPREGYWALEGYATLLLPRWLGEPGELVAAADELRKQVGNDDAYVAMASTALEYEGTDCLKAGHPVAIDWKRAIDSLEAAGRAKRLPPKLAQRYLNYCTILNRPADAKRVVPYAPVTEAPLRGQRHIVLLAQRLWASGWAEWPHRETHYSYKVDTPRRQKVHQGMELGYTVTLDRPKAYGTHFVFLVRGPRNYTRSGVDFDAFELIVNLDPVKGKYATCHFYPNDRVAPGRYTMFLYYQGKVLHKETFEIIP